MVKFLLILGKVCLKIFIVFKMYVFFLCLFVEFLVVLANEKKCYFGFFSEFIRNFYVRVVRVFRGLD